jgi:hypothetical protein
MSEDKNNISNDSEKKLNPLFYKAINYLTNIKETTPTIAYFMAKPDPSTLNPPPVHNKLFDDLAKKINSGEEVLVTPRELSTILYPNDKDKINRDNQLRLLCKLLDTGNLEFHDDLEEGSAYGYNDQEERFKIITGLKFSLDQFYTRLSKKNHGGTLSLNLGERHGDFSWETKKTKTKIKKDSKTSQKQFKALESLINSWRRKYKFEINRYTINKEPIPRIKLPLTNKELIQILKKFDASTFGHFSNTAEIKEQNFWRLRKRLCVFNEQDQFEKEPNRTTRALILKEDL